MDVDDKTHLKIVNFFNWILFFSALITFGFVVTHIRWVYYGIFWTGCGLIIINMILHDMAEDHLRDNIYLDENLYEE